MLAEIGYAALKIEYESTRCLRDRRSLDKVFNGLHVIGVIMVEVFSKSVKSERTLCKIQIVNFTNFIQNLFFFWENT